MQIGFVMLGAIAASIIAIIAFRLRSLSLSGAIASAVVGTIIFAIGGFSAAVLLITFFASSSLLSRLPGNEGVAIDKSPRDWKQVAANGLVPMLAMLLLATVPRLREEATLLFLGAIATSTADTWATEIGTRFGKKTLDLTTLRVTIRGTSGGVSLTGSVASLLGALLIGIMASVHFPYSELCELQEIPVLQIITLAGFLGALSDSLLGSGLQGKFACSVCETHTEEHYHCGQRTILKRGFSFFSNNKINLISSLIGAIICLYLLDFVK
ncbi:MAG: DUF92 domain-containing protein [Candidatus Kapaibacterium sp.]